MPLPYLYINININLPHQMCHFRDTSHLPQAVGQPFGPKSPHFCPPKKPSRNSSSWWLSHPFENVCSSKWEASPKFWVNIFFLKPPPSLGSKDPRASSQSPSSKHFTRWWHRVTSSWTRTPRTKNASNGASGKKNRHEKKTCGGFFLLSIKKPVIYQTF